MDKKALFEDISKNILMCRKCALGSSRKNAVPGEGSVDAEIMFIGEGPGREEDLQGRPFVGAAGKFLDELLCDIGYTREEVFIGNIIKCRPPNNRVPMPWEIEVCIPYLYAQIAIIEPKIICTLGNTPLNALVSSKLTIGTVHGTLLEKDGFKFSPMYHPAAVLYHGELKGTLKKDFLKLKELLNAEQK
ncbi:MAG: uracil-DNA glycosylase [Caldiserica bacterium CG02_land_8_20_14_3_00_36_38]|nr:uracil-DNA glycosylase [Caldisericota bacterium]NCQ52586.1 uracil-DNA glycosylase [Caldisericota bacterium]OIP13744.1 MAG: uracil-DNA glycosylase [Caldisericum sp. CG2_30_36_11]PIP49330.1 MAG: uracil-DNA glycosylase [Caldiserica bacterium CG23_combo_of_CG06-09_8_20_14_all_35_60]PIV54723.1 MAG: uracil-DNA glycosylase [Caldiserica bacterium CG02_land_8_20_14_3_00_36_38]